MRAQKIPHRVTALRSSQSNIVLMHVEQKQQLLWVPVDEQVQNSTAYLLRYAGFDLNGDPTANRSINEPTGVACPSIINAACFPGSVKGRSGSE